ARSPLPAIVAVFAGSATVPPGLDSGSQIASARFRQILRSGAGVPGLPRAVSRPDCAPREISSREGSGAIFRAANAGIRAGTTPEQSPLHRVRISPEPADIAEAGRATPRIILRPRSRKKKESARLHQPALKVPTIERNLNR